MKKASTIVIFLILAAIIVIGIFKALDLFKPTYTVFTSDNLGIILTNEIKAENDDEAYKHAALQFYIRYKSDLNQPKRKPYKMPKFDVKKEGEKKFVSQILLPHIKDSLENLALKIVDGQH